MMRLPLTDPVRDYAPLAHFAEPAFPTRAVWRVVAGTGLAAAFYIGVMMLIFRLAEDNLGSWWSGFILAAVADGRTPEGLTALLYTFLPLALGVFLAARLLHGRDPVSLIGQREQAVADFWRVALPVFAFAVVMMPFSVFSENVGQHMTIAAQVWWLPLALPGLLIQTGAEELAFRGYLLQQLAARFRSPLVWMVLPSVLFGLLHYDPATFGPNAWPVVAWAVAFGILASDLTARTGTLGAAIGLHFATNASSMLLVGLYGNLDGLALYNVVINLRDPSAVWPLLIADALGLIVSWLIARLALRL